MFRSIARVALVLAVLTAPAFSEIINVNGTLQSDPLPEGYGYDSSCLAVVAKEFRIEVVGKSKAGTAALPSVARPGAGSAVQQVLFAGTDGKAQYATELFALPPVLVDVGGKVHYRSGAWNLSIGDVIGVGDARWVRFRKGAAVQANLKTARLVLDTDKLSKPTRTALFDRLHGR